MYKISKTFEFDYGHRVWTQELDDETFSLDTQCACRHLHGHRAKVIITLSSKTLRNNMVTDFKNLNWLKKFLDDTLDHKMLMDVNDPLVPSMYPKFKAGYTEKGMVNLNFNELLETKEESELYFGTTFLNFVPTSENLSKWLYEIVQDKMKEINIIVDSVEFYETPKSKSVYYANTNN